MSKWVGARQLFLWSKYRHLLWSTPISISLPSTALRAYISGHHLIVLYWNPWVWKPYFSQQLYIIWMEGIWCIPGMGPPYLVSLTLIIVIINTTYKYKDNTVLHWGSIQRILGLCPNDTMKCSSHFNLMYVY